MRKIAIVGCDGAGKSSAVRSLSAALTDFVRVKQIDKWDVLDRQTFPEYSFIVPDLPSLRRCVSDMSEVTRTLFLFWMLHGTLLPKTTADIDVAILDGYWPKHAAAEIVYSGQRRLVESLCGIMPRPDLTLFLNVDPAVAYRRRVADATHLVPYECGLDRLCSEAGFMRHQSAVREILLGWCDKFKWTMIDANNSRETVLDAVVSAANAFLAEPPCY